MIINTDEQIKVVSIGTEERLVANKIDGDTVFKATDLQMGGGAVDPYEGAYTVTPSTYTQTLDINGKTATQDIIIEPMPLGTATTPETSATENPSISIDNAGLVTAIYSKSIGVTPTVEAGYVSSGVEGTVTVSGSSSMQLTTQDGTTITPNETVQTAVARNTYTLGDVTVDAIPSNYVGSGITQRTASDVTVNGANVTAPSGYYSNAVSKTVASGTEGTPTATKGSVNNHSVSVTPSVTNAEGYISGGSHSGSPVTVSASELVSGTKTITENGENIDVVNYEDVTVNVEGSSVNLESGSATISAAGTLEHTPSTGYDGFDTFTTTVPSASIMHGRTYEYSDNGIGRMWNLRWNVHAESPGWFSGYNYSDWIPFNAVRSGTTITPSTSSQTVGGENWHMEGAVTVEAMPEGVFEDPYTFGTNNDTTISISPSGLVTAEVLKSTSFYPVETSGYIDSTTPASIVIEGTATHQLTTQGATTYRWSESDRTIAGGTYLTGNQVIKGVPLQTISKITQNGRYQYDDGYYGFKGDIVVDVPSASPNLQSKTYTVDSAGTDTITYDSGYDGLSEVEVSVPSASFYTDTSFGFFTENNTRKWRFKGQTIIDPSEGGHAGWLNEGIYDGNYFNFSAVPSNTTITPTESSQTIGGYNYMMEGAVTVGAIPSNYVGSGITRRNDTDLIGVYDDGVYSVNVPQGYYQFTSYVNVPNGTEGTPTATKGSVSNHSVSVTPSVTNTAGYITGSTKTGTAVSVSASELVSGSQTVTENGTVDVTNLAEVVVDVSGGGSSGVSIGTATRTLSASASSIQFTGLSGNPTSFIITSSGDVATNTNGVTAVAYDGTSLHGQTMTTQVEADTGFTKSYSGGTLTVTASTASFVANTYKLVYTYGGSSSDIHTADVQVGSGATSITFAVSGRPQYWSCVFKSDFSTSSGYQRVIAVANDGSSTYGLAMDSSAHASTAWTATYSGGNLTITSQGTNNGGYFHQPGYYQLTYSVDDSAPTYQTKTVSPTTSQQTVTPDVGYDALEEVIVNAMPTMTLPSATSATSSGTSKATITPSSSAQYLNIPTGYNGTAQYYTISASGGGSSKNVQVLQSTSRTSSSSLTKVLGDLTVSKTGTYDIYWSGGRSNTSTSYTWGTRLYVDGSGYDTENTTWSNNCQSNHLSNVSLTANQKLSVYARGRTGSYYTFAPMLVIVEA